MKRIQKSIGVFGLGTLLLAIADLPLARGQTPCGWPDPLPDCAHYDNFDRKLPAFATPQPGCADPCDVTPYRSQCWSRHWTGDANDRPWWGDGAVNGLGGLRLNLDLVKGVIAPSFVPPGQTPAQTTLPMVPNELKHLVSRPSDHRPTLRGEVDLVTGADLLREQDLVLPFGSSEYRLIRTHSMRYPHFEKAFVPADGEQVTVPSGYWWDWFGTGWMTSSNPILLIDATYSELVDNKGTPPEGAKCFFLADTFHSIPFDQQTDNGLYTAPPQFRAQLIAVGGTWSSGAWSDLPETYELWLQDGALKYTIKAYYEDIPDERRADDQVFSAHERPTQVNDGLSGTGMPHYGLVKKIEDRYGNRIEFFHADDLPGGLWQKHVPHAGREAEGCWSCEQNCVDKGQLRYAKLYAAGQTSAVWTVLFQHRRATGVHGHDNDDFGPEYPIDRQWLFTPTALHGVYTYAYDLNIASLQNWKWVLEDWMFWKGPTDELAQRYDETTAALKQDPPGTAPEPWDGLERLEEVEDYVAYPEFGPKGLPSDWTHHVKYLYVDPARYLYAQSPEWRALILDDAKGASPRVWAGDLRSPGWYDLQLVKVSVDTQTQPETNGGGTRLSDTSIYRYSAEARHFYGVQSVFRPEAVQRVVESLGAANCPCDCGVLAEDVSAFCLLRMSDTAPIPASIGGETTNVESVDLISAADVYYPTFSVANSPPPSHWFLATLTDEFVPLNKDRLIALTPDIVGVSRATIANGEGGKRTAHRLYQFLNMPGLGFPLQNPEDACHTLEDTSYVHLPQSSLLHTPNRWKTYDGTSPNAGVINCNELYEPTWITVVDTFDDEDHADINPFNVSESEKDTVPSPRTRRVIQMNAVGFILRDQTWEFDGKFMTLASTTGFGAEYEYDDQNRLVELRSAAWSTQTTQAAKDTDGLIQVFEYAYAGSDPDGNPDPDDKRRVPHRVGVKKGETGTPVWTTQQWFHPNRHDLVIRERRFANTEGTAFEEMRSLYTLEAAPDTTPTEYRVTGVDRVSSACRKDESDSRLFKNVTKDRFDSRGNLVWHGYGSLQSETGAAQTGDRFYVDFTLRDVRGRVLAQVVDYAADEEELPSHYPDGADIPALPTGLDRRPVHVAGTPNAALHATTAYEYNEHGVSKATFPTGRIDLYKWKLAREQEVYRGMLPVEGGFLSTGTGSITNGGPNEMYRWVQEAIWVPDGATINPELGNPPSAIRATITPNIDASGRPAGVEVSTTDGSNTKVSIIYSSGGNIARSKSTRGVLTRYVHDDLGLKTHTFRGTADTHVFWNNAAPTGPFDDNMKLVEKRYYGTGVHDLNLPVAIRRYRQPVSNQYDPVLSAEDQTGWAEEFEYDWRLRSVLSREREETTSSTTPNALRHTLTFYDNLDRVRFVATYGPELPSLGTMDPRTAAASTNPPTAEELLETDPLALTETIYNARGEVEETREFNVDTSLSAATRAAQYTFTKTFYDHNGQPTLIASTNSPTSVIEYDAVGRETVRSLKAGAVEVERQENTYGVEGGPKVEARRERTSAAGDSLSSTNSVRTVVHNLYDPKNRLVAKVDWGTGRTDSTFDGYADTIDIPDDPLELTFAQAVTGTANDRWTAVRNGYSLGTTPRAKITAYKYDDRDLVLEMVNPIGSLTEYLYNDSGQLIYMRENAGATQWNQRRATGYQYSNGLLTAIAAVQNGSAGPVTNWNNHQDMQVTRVEYGTNEVKYDDASTGSFTGELPKAIRFSAAPCAPDVNQSGSVTVDDVFNFLNAWFAGCSGQATAECEFNGTYINADYNLSGTLQPQDIFEFLNDWFAPPVGCSNAPGDGDLLFTYTADGQVRSREFPNNSKFVYAYDELGRLTAIDAVDPSGICVGASAPMNAISHIGYEYDTLGRLIRSDAYSQTIAGTTGQHVVASSLFRYDGLGRLTAEHMSFGSLATISSPATQYTWQTLLAQSGSTLTGIQSSRLSGMVYPLTHQVGNAPRERQLALHYGSSGSVNDLLSRLQELSDLNTNTTLAKYSYAGTSRLVSMDRGSLTLGSSTQPAIKQSFLVSSGGNDYLSGLDAFGRVKELAYVGQNTDSTSTAFGSPLDLFRAVHTYDTVDNRLTDTVTRSSSGGGSLFATEGNHSWGFGYDKLMRLISAKTGQATSPGVIEENEHRTDHAWTMDDLGNWGRPNVSTHEKEGGYLVSSFAVAYDANNDPYDPSARTELHYTNDRNELGTAKITDPFGGESNRPYTYDRQGRLTSDGEFLHRYDAWGRLCELRTTGLAFDQYGAQLDPLGSGAAGAVAAHYTYDGLGRLIATQKPASRDSADAPTSLRLTRHYYDGARRIQDESSSAFAGSEPVAMNFAFDPDGTSGPKSAATAAAAANYGLERDYIYDPSGDVDAHVAQYGYTYPSGSGVWGAGNDSGVLLYVLQDVNLNTIALADANGRPVAQVGYTPYGVPNLFDIQQPGTTEATLANTNPVGHQGLFYDRFDLDAPGTGGAGVNADGVVQSTLSGSSGYYHNRNRTYAQRLGRFLQRDPESGGQMVLSTLHRNGSGCATCTRQDPSVLNLYSDGMNPHQYEGSSPSNQLDPAGMDFGLAGQLAMMGVNSYLDATGNLQEAEEHLRFTFGVQQMLRNYRLALEDDVEWASDWSRSDFDYSRTNYDPESASQCQVNSAPSTPIMAGLTKGVRRSVYEARVEKFGKIRKKIWADEGRNNGAFWRERGATDADIENMKQGKAFDGWIIHHNKPRFQGGTNRYQNLTIMRGGDHTGNFGRIHRPGVSGTPSIPGRRTTSGQRCKIIY